MEHVVIIGNGIAGVTAARHIRKRNSDIRITIISSETDYFYSRTALMYIYMGHMRFKDTQPYEPWFWKKNRIELKMAYVDQIDFANKSLNCDDGSLLTYDKLILAVGSKPNKFGWPGQDLTGVQGLYSYQDLELLEENSKGADRAVIVGGGLIGVELAEMLVSRGIKVTFLVRDKYFWGSVLPDEEAKLITQHIQKHHVDLRLSEELDEILEGSDGRVRAVKLKTSGEEVECQIVGLTTGVRPNVDFLKGSTLEIDKGILVNRYLETNQPDVYAVGDCAQFREPSKGRRAMEQVWYTGRIMGEIVASTITGDRKEYKPGHWFNSAKFFDIEYQTYGVVNAVLRENENEFYWQHETKELAMHFVFDSGSKQFLGVNTFGIRLRHELFDRWLTEERDIEYVLTHLKDANFDPELYASHEDQILEVYNQKFNASIKPKKKDWMRILSF